MDAAAEFVARVNDAIINPIIALIFAAGLLMFLWGGMQFIFSAASEKGREEGRQHMFWGVIGMVIMVCVFTILTITLHTFGVTADDVPDQLPLPL